MDQIETLLRLGAGMLVGLAVGLEREHAQRPAGMRTHLLVAIGSASVTVAGARVSELVGGDPLRLAAQVISGIGFLGAGTILKEGVNIRGLTTSASLWVTACLAIVAGFGLYIEAAAGTFAILIALTALERVERLMTQRHSMTSALLEVTVEEGDALSEALSNILRHHGIETRGVSIEHNQCSTHLEIRIRSRSRAVLAAALDEISIHPGVRHVSVNMMLD